MNIEKPLVDGKAVNVGSNLYSDLYKSDVTVVGLHKDKDNKWIISAKLPEGEKILFREFELTQLC